MNWSKKKFWNSFKISFSSEYESYLIFLDDKIYRTQKGNILKVPSESLAKKVANEWKKNTKEFRHSKLVLTNLLGQINDIDDKTNNQYLREVLEYVRTDLLCYRASSPKKLVRLQEKNWDPILSIYDREFSIKMLSTNSLDYVNQNKDSLDKFYRILIAYDSPRLFLIYKITQFLNSALLSVLIERNVISDEKAWKLSQLEEDWQKRIWGKDEESLEAEKNKKKAFKLVIACLRHLGTS